MENKDIFTIRLCEALRFSQIKQVQLAKNIGISPQCLSDFKSGKAYPGIHTLRLLCKALDVSADYLLGIED